MLIKSKFRCLPLRVGTKTGAKLVVFRQLAKCKCDFFALNTFFSSHYGIKSCSLVV